MRGLIYILVFITTFYSSSLFAQWYEAQGHAVIKQGNKQTARQQAMQQALKKALLVAGASVSSVQQVVNGLLTEDQLSVRASGEVDSVEIISENYQDNEVTVTIRADIFPQEAQCSSASYKKTVLLTRSYLRHRQQANIGSIYAIDKVLVEHLANTLSEQSQFVSYQTALNQRLPFSKLQLSTNHEPLKQLAMSLATISDSQFVLFSEINDVSFGRDVQNSWQFWQEDQFERQFNVSFYLFNGENGELAFSKQYQGKALWPFSKRENIDVNSATFWQTDYGQMIENLLNQTVMDLDEQLACQTTRGKIVQVNGNEIMINLGAKHGVKIGDRFSLLHWHNFTADNGKTYAGYNISPYEVEITQVTAESAIAHSIDDGLLGNIQINDFAVKH